MTKKEKIKQLLSAMVDGELAPHEVQLVERILARSDKARRLLATLKANAERLASLPRHTLPPGLRDRVLQSIKTRGLKTRMPVAARRLWWPAAAAAGLIFALGLGTYYLIDRLNPPSPPVANLPPASNPNEKPVDPGERIVNPDTPKPKAPDWAEVRKQIPSKEDLNKQLAALRSLVEPVADTLVGLVTSAPGDLARIFGSERGTEEMPFNGPTIYTAPSSIKNPFKTVEVKLPLFVDVRKLDATKLMDRLGEDHLHYFDFSCGESRASFDRFQVACRTAGINLIVDPELKKAHEKKLPVVWMVYLENTTPDQVLKLMKALQAEEKKAEQKKTDLQFHSLMVQSLDAEGRKRLADALGVSAGSLAPVKPQPKGMPEGLDPTKPISNETFKILDRLTAGQGTRSQMKEAPPTAVALVYYPNRNRKILPKEIKQYYDSRSGWRPETVHIVMLLRPNKAGKP